MGASSNTWERESKSWANPIGVWPKNSAAHLLAEYLYTYDAAGGVTSETINGVTKTYTYDSTSQLTDDNGTGYSYDAAGNRSNTGYVTGPNNQLLSDGIWNYSYDLEGNLVGKTNINSGETWSFTYDNANHRTMAEQRDNSGAVLMHADYVFDVFGNRFSKTVTQGALSTTTRFAYNNGVLWADLDATGSLTTRYIAGDQPNEWLALVDAAGVAWLLADRLGSIRDITTAAGVVLAHIDYDAFGNVTAESNPSLSGRLQYAGYEWDAEANLYFDKARDYDPATGRFTSQDPTGFPDGPNNYLYVKNNPTNATDPWGLYDKDVFEDNVLTIAELDKDAAIALKWFNDKSGTYYIGYRGWFNPGKLFTKRNVGVWENCKPAIYLDSSQNDANLARAFYRVLLEQDVYGFKSDVAAEKIDHPEFDSVQAYKGFMDDYLRTSASVVSIGARGVTSLYAVGGGGWVFTAEDLEDGNYISAAMGMLPLAAGSAVKVVAKSGQVLSKVSANTISKLRESYRASHGNLKGFKVPVSLGKFFSALEYGIQPYNQLRQKIAGALQAHHLIEQRFARKLGVDPNTMLAIALTPAEHQVFTNAWRREIGHIGDSVPIRTDNATRQQIMDAARRIYNDFPDILRAMGL